MHSQRDPGRPVLDACQFDGGLQDILLIDPAGTVIIAGNIGDLAEGGDSLRVNLRQFPLLQHLDELFPDRAQDLQLLITGGSIKTFRLQAELARSQFP